MVQPAPRARQVPRRRLFRRGGAPRGAGTAAMSATTSTEGGYYMRTTLDPRLQTAARIALMDGLETYDRRHGWRGAWGHVAIVPGWQKAALAAPPPSERKKWQAAVVTESRAATVRSQIADDNSAGRIVPADVAWAQAGKGLRSATWCSSSPSDNGPASTCARSRRSTARSWPWTPTPAGCWPWSAATASRCPTSTAPPRPIASPARRSSRSSTPRRWRTAFTPASIVSTRPITPAGLQRPGLEAGELRAQVPRPAGLPPRPGAVAQHHDRAHRRAGRHAEDRRQRHERFGVVDKMDPVLAMALGAGETTPFRMTGAYSAFVNGGRKINPHLIELVEDRDGKTIYARRQPRMLATATPRLHRRRRAGHSRPAGQQLVDPITAYQIATMLEGVVQHGTGDPGAACWAGRSAARPAPPTTSAAPGSSASRRRSWSAPSSASTTTARWAQGETGAVAAVPIFIEFMQEALKGYADDGLHRPARHRVRPGRPQPRGVPARHRAHAAGRRRRRWAAVTRTPATPFTPPAPPPAAAGSAAEPASAPRRPRQAGKPSELNGLF